MRDVKEILSYLIVGIFILMVITFGVILTSRISEELFSYFVEPVQTFYIKQVHTRAYEKNLETNNVMTDDKNERLNTLLKISNVYEEHQELSPLLEWISIILPESVLSLLETNHVLIEFVDYDLTLIDESFTDVNGFYDMRFKKIYIDASQIGQGYQVTLAVFLHEVGHAIDQLFNQSIEHNPDLLSRESTFEELFLKTRDVLMSPFSYGYDDQIEYFAQMIYLYYYAPTVLADRSLLMYEFMQTIDSSITEWNKAKEL